MIGCYQLGTWAFSSRYRDRVTALTLSYQQLKKTKPYWDLRIIFLIVIYVAIGIGVNLGLSP